MRKVTVTGLWHLPGDPSNAVAGTLRWTPQDGAILSLTGTLAKEPAALGVNAERYKVVHGVVTESPIGKWITLTDCFQKHMRVSIPGFATQQLRARRAFAGEHLLDDANLSFTGAQIRFSELADWVGHRGTLRHEIAKEGERIVGGDVAYRFPAPIAMTFGEADLRIDAGYDVRLDFVTTLRIEEQVLLSANFPEHLSVDDIHARCVRPLQNFLSLATDTPNAVEDFRVMKPELTIAHTQALAPIHVLTHPVFVLGEPTPQKTPDDMLFVLADVSDRLTETLERWLKLVQEDAPFCSMFFSMLESPSKFVDVRFLLLVEAMALYLYKRLGGGGEEYRRVVRDLHATLTNAASEDARKWISESMPSESDLALGQTLRDALVRNEGIMDPLTASSPSAFVDRVLATRRYLLHRDDASRAAAASGAELHWLIEKLLVLIKAMLLRDLGFEPAAIAGFFGRNRRYLHLKTV